MIKEEVEGRATNNNKIQAPRIEETTFPIAASNTLDQNLVFEFSLPPLHFFIHYKPTESAVNEGLNTYKTSTGKSLFLRQQQQTKLLERFGIYRSSGVGICSGGDSTTIITFPFKTISFWRRRLGKFMDMEN
uniref:Uncharacterized protein n=1 Tax=Meloidogyne enterolobii TaxID=390850 RepID=A0A6V7X817_MELEN|nr:unnamed protein product [Meloidogyne enterolobii]CAD2204758.1 unnamed protein product [Meloidogyne enterolobii]